MRGILREQIPVLVLAVGIGILAGQILATREAALIAIPVLLILVPPVNNAAGMIGSVLGARVSTGLHTGSLLSDGARQFRRDVAATLILGIFTFLGLAALAVLAAIALGERSGHLLADLVVIVGGAGTLLIVGMLLIVILIGTLSFHMGWDPDNIIIPVVTASGDIIGIASLIVMVQWVGL